MIFEPKIGCTVVHVMREPDTIKRIKTMNQFVTNVSMARMLWLGRGSKRMKIKITVNLACIFANEIRLTKKKKKSWKCSGFEFCVFYGVFWSIWASFPAICCILELKSIICIFHQIVHGFPSFFHIFCRCLDCLCE